MVFFFIILPFFIIIIDSFFFFCYDRDKKGAVFFSFLFFLFYGICFFFLVCPFCWLFFFIYLIVNSLRGSTVNCVWGGGDGVGGSGLVRLGVFCVFFFSLFIFY